MSTQFYIGSESTDLVQDDLPYHYLVKCSLDLNSIVLSNLSITINGGTVTGSGQFEFSNAITAASGATSISQSVAAATMFHNAMEKIVMTVNADGTGTDTEMETRLEDWVSVGLMDVGTSWAHYLLHTLVDIDGGTKGSNGLSDAFARYCHASNRLTSTADTTDTTGLIALQPGDTIAVTLVCDLRINMSPYDESLRGFDGQTLKFKSNPNNSFTAEPGMIYTRLVLEQS